MIDHLYRFRLDFEESVWRSWLVYACMVRASESKAAHYCMHSGPSVPQIEL